MTPQDLPLPTRLEQLAEECAELTQAALKYARYLRGENPTPKTSSELVTNLIEELSDVMVAIQAFEDTGIQPNEMLIESKLKRWEMRLNERTFGEDGQGIPGDDPFDE